MTTLDSKKKAARLVGGQFSDAIGRDADGNIRFMKGYFYKMGRTAQDFADNVSMSLSLADIDHEVVNVYDQFKPFRGGDTVRQGSHFGVLIKVL